MTLINKIIMETIENTEFVHMFDFEFQVFVDYTFDDITKFFDYCLYNISKIDHNVIENYNQICQEYHLNIKLQEIKFANALMKSITIPKNTDIENLYMDIYNKHINVLENMFNTCCSLGKCVFFIFCPNFPNDILLIISYKDKWIDTIKKNISLSDLKELDLIIFLSGYTYIFKSKNIFNNILNSSLENNRIYILYYA